MRAMEVAPFVKRKSLVLALIFGLASAPFAAYAEGVPPGAATIEQVERAQALFLLGKSEMDAGRHEAALASFRASFDTVASPNSHLFIARVLAASGDLAAAHYEYGRVSEGARQAALLDPKYADTQAAADAERAELSSKIGLLVLHVENAGPGATVMVGGQTIPQERLGAPLAVQPGLIEVSASSPGSPDARGIVLIGAGEQRDLHLALAPAAQAPGPFTEAPLEEDTDLFETRRKRVRTAAYVAGGVGAAGLATFAIAGSMARSQYATLSDECGGPCPAARQADIDAGRRSQTIANVGLAIGAVGLGTGTVLFLLSRPKAPEASTEPPSVAGFKAEVLAGPSWLGLRGTFQ